MRPKKDPITIDLQQINSSIPYLPEYLADKLSKMQHINKNKFDAIINSNVPLNTDKNINEMLVALSRQQTIMNELLKRVPIQVQTHHLNCQQNPQQQIPSQSVYKHKKITSFDSEEFDNDVYNLEDGYLDRIRIDMPTPSNKQEFWGQIRQNLDFFHE